MSEPRCSRCGAELLAGANFCRQCGSVVNSTTSSSELPTAVIGQTTDHSATRRLDARPTSPEQGFRDSAASAVSKQTGVFSQKRSAYVALTLLVLSLVAAGLITWIIFGHNSAHQMMGTDPMLVYPGSKTIVDTTNDDGRVIHLETGDSVELVVAWYTANLKPTKTMRLTPTTVVLKNQNVTATVAAEDNKTNILIKQAR